MKAIPLGLIPLGLVAALVVGCATGPPVRTAAWVVRDRLETPSDVASWCEAARDAGLDRVVVQVRGRGDAYYASSIAVPAEVLAGAPDGFDPLSEVVSRCGGLQVDAWINVFYVWGGDVPPVDPGHVSQAHPDWGLADVDGRPVAAYTREERALGWIEGLYADPAAEGYRGQMARIAAELVERYPVAGVHLDFVRYPGASYGRGPPLGGWFQGAWGLDPRYLPPDVGVDDLGPWLAGTMGRADRVLTTLWLLWVEARARQVSRLVAAVRRAVDGVRPGVEVSAAVYPEPGRAYRAMGQDWREWAAAGWVDALYPMAYFGGIERVEGQLARFAERVRPVSSGVELWAGLGAYIKDPETVGLEARRARALGYDGVCLFDLGTVADGPIGLAPYVRAVSGPPAPPGPIGERRWSPRTPATAGGRALAAVVERATGGRPPVGATGAFDARWTEVVALADGGWDRVYDALGDEPVLVPPWVELHGVFRYVDPGDGRARRIEQRRVLEDARTRILTGEAFEVVVREVSQGGTRNLGGGLGRRYLTRGTPGRAALAEARPGAVTEVVEVSNGYWFYRVDARGPGRIVPFVDAPWPARRAALRRALVRFSIAAGGQRISPQPTPRPVTSNP